MHTFLRIALVIALVLARPLWTMILWPVDTWAIVRMV